MPESSEAIIYEESKRALTYQASALDELRSRTGLLLAAAAVTGSFLGAEATRQEGIEFLGGAAIVAFGAAVGACLYILLPRKDAWVFVVSAKTLLEDWVDTDRGGTDAMLRFMAEKLEVHYDANKDQLADLYRWFQAASVAIGAEVLLWTLQLAS